MNINLIHIIGRIGKHVPSLKQAGKGSYAGFHVAVNTGYGERQKTSWFHVRLWGKAGEAFVRYCEPGQEVAITGEHVQEKWEKDGEKHEMWVLHSWKGELGQKPRGSSNGGGTGRHAKGPSGDYSDEQPTQSEVTDTDDVPF